MIVVSRNKLVNALEMHPTANQSLLGWYKVISESKFSSEQDLRTTFSGINSREDRFDFSIPGTDLQIRTLINFDTQVTYIETIRPSRL
ncbi:MAG: type II toxin-antitoxin system HigB family toxin [Kangiellaceae bacterium]|nr:type II toxin-antitoxin system HigB family toxin [Kangiellaceae bacterium]